MKYGITTAFTALATASALYANEPVWDANIVELEAQELADGVFAVIPTGAKELSEKGMPIATSSGFVIGDNGVLVIDTMLNERLNKQLMDLIDAQTDLPVLYAVNTSYHGDHHMVTNICQMKQLSFNMSTLLNLLPIIWMQTKSS